MRYFDAHFVTVFHEYLCFVYFKWPLKKGGSIVVDLLLIYCLIYFPLFVGVLCLFLFCYALLCVHSSFAIILERKRKLITLLLMSCRCIVTINVLWLFLVVS